MYNKIAVKIQTDVEERFEDLPALIFEVGHGKKREARIDRIVHSIASSKSVVQVRWEFYKEGTYGQGHYVPGPAYRPQNTKIVRIR